MKTLTKWRLLMSLRGTLIAGLTFIPFFVFLPLILDIVNGNYYKELLISFFIIYLPSLILNFFVASFSYSKDSVVNFLGKRIKKVSEKREKASDIQMDLELSKKLHKLYSALSKIKRDC